MLNAFVLIPSEGEFDDDYSLAQSRGQGGRGCAEYRLKCPWSLFTVSTLGVVEGFSFALSHSVFPFSLKSNVWAEMALKSRVLPHRENVAQMYTNKITVLLFFEDVK